MNSMRKSIWTNYHIILLENLQVEQLWHLQHLVWFKGKAMNFCEFFFGVAHNLAVISAGLNNCADPLGDETSKMPKNEDGQGYEKKSVCMEYGFPFTNVLGDLRISIILTTFPLAKQKLLPSFEDTTKLLPMSNWSFVRGNNWLHVSDSFNDSFSFNLLITCWRGKCLPCTRCFMCPKLFSKGNAENLSRHPNLLTQSPRWSRRWTFKVTKCLS